MNPLIFQEPTPFQNTTNNSLESKIQVLKKEIEENKM
jgi:hypothetical protein